MTSEELEQMEHDRLLEQQKKDKIEAAKKKRATTIFMTLVSIISILITIILAFAIFLLCTIILVKCFGSDSKVAGTIYSILVVALFVGCIIGGVAFTRVLGRFGLRKLHFDQKVSKDCIEFYRSAKETKALKHE